MSAPDPERCWVQNFCEVVRHHGNRTAIETAEGRNWTYNQLWDHALDLGVQFTIQGVRRGDTVAILLPRSPEFVAGIIASWICGAVALPMDTTVPRQRTTEILNESKPAFVLREYSYSGTKPSGEMAESSLDDPAYLIYTSGSSGKPKGVLVSHAGLCRVLAAQIRMFHITTESRCWWMHGTGFDASLSDIGTALLAGAALCFAEQTVELEPTLLRMGITHIDLPPSLLPYLREKPPSLEVIVIGGEACPPPIIRQWARKVRLINVYGPTEATICTSMMVCGADWDRAWIGNPVPGVSYQILDGELQISGPAVALGYPWMPELWNQRYVGGWYRTGDLVAQHPDGRIEFLGRLDRQIKLNSRLICPEEIERALMELPEVKRVHVLEWRRGTYRLLAAAVEGMAAISTLVGSMQGRFPSWMVPTVWTVVDKLPVLANNKVDTGAIHALLLQEIEKRASLPTESYSEDERAVAEIFSECLQIPNIRRHEDFFHDLGGDSLAVVAVMAMAAQRSLQLPSDAVSRGRTVAGVAALLHSLEFVTREELERDLRIPQLHFSGTATAPSHVLVTGATGFLGRAIVAELKKQKVKVTTLSRTSQLCGDVRLPQFGWSHPVWTDLANEVDAVFHLAAEVKLFEPYKALRESQVEGTRNVLHFCATGRAKSLHFASSLSVFVDADPLETWCGESDLRRGIRGLHGGYAQSKWVAEQLVLLAREAGLSAWVHRLGLLSMNTETGDAPRNDWLTLALPGLKGSDDNLELDLTPVDFAAKTMVHLAFHAPPGIYHIANSQPVTLAQLAALNSSAQISSAADLAAMRRNSRLFYRSLDLFKATGVRFDMTNTLKSIAGSGIEFPEISPQYLQACLHHATQQTLT